MRCGREFIGKANVSAGVPQGSPGSPLLFVLGLAPLLFAFRESTRGLPATRSQNAKSRHSADFADDCTVFARENELRLIRDIAESFCKASNLQMGYPCPCLPIGPFSSLPPSSFSVVFSRKVLGVQISNSSDEILAEENLSIGLAAVASAWCARRSFAKNLFHRLMVVNGALFPLLAYRFVSIPLPQDCSPVDKVMRDHVLAGSRFTTAASLCSSKSSGGLGLLVFRDYVSALRLRRLDLVLRGQVAESWSEDILEDLDLEADVEGSILSPMYGWPDFGSSWESQTLWALKKIQGLPDPSSCKAVGASLSHSSFRAGALYPLSAARKPSLFSPPKASIGSRMLIGNALRTPPRSSFARIWIQISSTSSSGTSSPFPPLGRTRWTRFLSQIVFSFFPFIEGDPP